MKQVRPIISSFFYIDEFRVIFYAIGSNFPLIIFFMRVKPTYKGSELDRFDDEVRNIDVSICYCCVVLLTGRAE